jgi:copper chaperone CopZ
VLTSCPAITDRREEYMPDVTLVVRDLKDAGEAERLERALTRLSFVNLVNVDSEKGLVAFSYEGGAEELERIEQAVTDAGHDFEPSPGASQVED